MNEATYTLVAWKFGDYDIISDGRVFSWKRGKFLKPGVSNGYPEVCLMLDGRRNQWRVHRLVAMAFYGPLPEGMQTRHLNGNKQDNRINNLKYGTVAENAQDKVLHGRSGKGISSPSASLTEEQVLSVKQALLAGVNYGDLAKEYGVSAHVMYGVASGRSYAHIGPQIKISYGRYASDDQKSTLVSMVKEGKAITEVANLIGFNIATVSRIFKSLTGQSIKQYRRVSTCQ